MRYNILIALVLSSLFSCSSNPPAQEEADFVPTPTSGEAKTQVASKGVTKLSMTYSNEASSLQLGLDPYDENLDIRMTRTPKPVPAVKEVVRKDTVYIQNAHQTVQTPQTIQQQAPIIVRDTIRKVDTMIVSELDSVALAEEMLRREQKLQRKLAEAMAQIRRAQTYFYKNDYASAWRLVKVAQEIYPTAEGFAMQGSIQYMLGDKEQAKVYWTEAVQRDPNLTEAIEALSKLQGAQ